MGKALVSLRGKFKIKTRRKKSLRSLCLCGQIILLLLAAGCRQLPTQKPPAKRVEPVVEVEPEFATEFDRLVWLLSSRDFDKRRAAHMELVKMGKIAVPALKKAMEDTADADHRRQIELVLMDLGSGLDEPQKKDLLVILSVPKKSFDAKSIIEITLEVKNTGSVPLDLTVPLVRKRSVRIELDWTADWTSVHGGKAQVFIASEKKRDEWLRGGWDPATLTVRPGGSLKQEIGITDMCTRHGRYTAVAIYLWEDVGQFWSNAVTFEVTKPPGEKQE